MRKSTLIQLQTLQTCFSGLFSEMVTQSVTSLMGGHKNMAYLSGKGHGKKFQENSQKIERKFSVFY